jgi:negative regulator of sigma E activity
MSLKVSRLLDGQLAPGEVKPALDETAADPKLRDRYTLYTLAGDVLRGNSTPDDGFSARIFERMQREGVQIEPGFDPLKDA